MVTTWSLPERMQTSNGSGPQWKALRDPEDLQQVKVLNRILTWDKHGISHEAGPRHVEIVPDELALKDAKGV